MTDDNGSSTPSTQTLVAEGSEFSGKLTSKVDILAQGRVEGELTAPALTVSSTGAVHGKVRVTTLDSAGELSGDLEADTIRLAGTVRDNTVIRAKTLEVRLGNENGKPQVVFGECELHVGDAPEDVKSAPKKPAARSKGRRSGIDAQDAGARPESES